MRRRTAKGALSVGDHWNRKGVLNNIDINFCNAGGVLFGVKEYVPALMKYIEKYDAHLHFMHNLTRIDGRAGEKPPGSQRPMPMATRKPSRQPST
jgi:hypothetical protein